MNRFLLTCLRRFGIVEGLSTLGLFFVAMPMKYMAGNPRGVEILGPLHGGLFIGLVALAIYAIDAVPIGKKLGMWVIVAAVVPFGPFVVDRWLKKLDTASPSQSD